MNFKKKKVNLKKGSSEVKWDNFKWISAACICIFSLKSRFRCYVHNLRDFLKRSYHKMHLNYLQLFKKSFKCVSRTTNISNLSITTSIVTLDGVRHLQEKRAFSTSLATLVSIISFSANFLSSINHLIVKLFSFCARKYNFWISWKFRLQE